MATVQTELQFNVRKKRYLNCKTKSGKENADIENVTVLRRPTYIGNEKLKKNINISEIARNIDNLDSDSDNECFTVKKNTQPIKRLLVSDIKDQHEDENLNTSPRKRGKTVEIAQVKNDIASSSHSPSNFTLSRYLEKCSSPSTEEKYEVGKHVSQTQCLPSGSKYQRVRQAFQSSNQTSMPGREEQLHQLHAFLDKCLSTGSSDTLYISGPPGTGKTACLSKIMDVPKFKNGYKIINVNCTSMKSSGLIYKRIAQELALKLNKQTEKECLLAIERHLNSNHKMILLVLDEIDQLHSQKQSVLYTIFEWPSKPNSKLVLIGIANALDLTDRTLPRLQARLDLKPTLLHFPPYTKLQIVNILTERIKQSGEYDMFPQVTLELLAGKVASTCGDIRRALDIARRGVEIAEAQKPDPPLPLQPTVDYGNRLSPRKTQKVSCKGMTTANSTSTRKSPQKNPNRGCVTLKDVMAVMNNVYGVSQSLAVDCDESFPLQQKVLVATLLLIIKKGSTKDVTIGKLHEVYKRVCNKKNFLAVDQSEFLSLCKLVETRGILRVQERKDARLSKVCLQWDEEEVSSALKDKQLLASILNDNSYLS